MHCNAKFVFFLLELIVIIIESSLYIFDYRTLIADFNLFWWKNDAAFLGYNVNISFLTEKIPHSQICGIKLGPS